MSSPGHSQRGFTLIEMIMVIVITGILSGMVAVFIKGPVESYFDMARRAELTDVADTAVRRIARDIRSSVPNTLRTPPGSDQCIEFMPAKTGARYRADQTAAHTGDILDFASVDDTFDMLGTNGLPVPPSSQIAPGDIVVVYNDGSTSGNAYAGTNAIQIDAGGVTVGDTDPVNTTKLSFVAPGATIFARKLFPSTSPANRFLVLPSNEQVVSFDCSSGTLYRYSRDITARTTTWSTPATCAAMTAGATRATLANNVTCSLKYEAPGSGTGSGRFGLVSISLGMTQSGETVSLYHQVHVDGTP